MRDQARYTPLEFPDPYDRRGGRLPLPRLWPWVLTGMVVALLAWAYHTPVPHLSTMDPITLGPDSPLYGPLTGKARP